MDRKPKHVILCFCDQLRAFELGCYGHKKIRTPNIDKLASEGYGFDCAVTNSPVCAPARASLISGQYSRTCAGVVDNTFANVLTQDRKRILSPTLAEQFKKYGYRTAVIGTWHSCTHPLRMGFDYSFSPRGGPDYSNRKFQENDGEMFQVDEFSPEYELSKVKEYISKNREAPFFLNYNIQIPHMPIFKGVPDKYRYMYNREDVMLRPNVWDEQSGNLVYNELWFKIYLYEGAFLGRIKEGVKSEDIHDCDLPEGFDLKDLTAMYDGLVSCVDDLIGGLLESLKESGIDEDTLVVLSSDHGDNLGSHGLFNKERLIEESIRIPMIFRNPGCIESGFNHNQIAQTIDIMPTLLDFAGIDIPPNVQGRSLMPLIRKEKDVLEDNYVYIETPFNHIGIRTPQYKYGFQLSKDHREITDDKYCFYDLEDDPYEFKNRAKTDYKPEIANELSGMLRKWNEQTKWHIVGESE